MEDTKLQGDATLINGQNVFSLILMKKKKKEMKSHIFSSLPKTKDSPLI